MAISSKPTIQYQNRSISLPSRSHPSTAKVEEQLSKIKSLEQPPTANNISNAFFGFENLYSSMNELLKLKNTQKALSQGDHRRFVDELQDELMSLLDVCGTAKDVVSQIKDHGRSIQSCIRRRKGDSDTEISITQYISFRKRMSKEARRLIAASKQMDSRIKSSKLLESDDHILSSVIRALRGVTTQTFTILHHLLLFLSVPVLKTRSSKWSLVSKLLHKGAVASHDDEANTVNELQSADTALRALFRSDPSDADTQHAALSSLQSLEVSTEAIENGLECLYRGLIKARSSLLNIVQLERSQYKIPHLIVTTLTV